MSGEWHHRHRLHLGPHHWPAGREGVGSRTRGGRDNDAIASKRFERASVDFDDNFEHALTTRLFDGRLVQCPGVKHDVGALLDSNIQRHQFLNHVVTGKNASDGFVDAVAFGFGKESNVTHVHANNWNCRVTDHLRSAQNGAVATNSKCEINVFDRDAGFEPFECGEVGCRLAHDRPFRLAQNRHDTLGNELTAGLDRSGQRLFLQNVRDDQHATS